MNHWFSYRSIGILQKRALCPDDVEKKHSIAYGQCAFVEATLRAF